MMKGIRATTTKQVANEDESHSAPQNPLFFLNLYKPVLQEWRNFIVAPQTP